ncbi:MAG TPA: signal peptidase I [Candidatus Polarisedimenticolia bacterium]|nr:signal peptidase I [Candidatus Polarisedimenticolia bacterium]
MRKSRVRDYSEAALVAVILSLFVRTFLFEAYRIPTPSMERSLMVGDHILVDKFALAPRLDFEGGLLPIRDVRRGDVVIFKFENEAEKDFVKRVVGLPGDEVKVQDKALWVNGKKLVEPYARHDDPETLRERDFLAAVTVPPGHYFVMGDNRDNSADSRELGFVPRSRIRGRALFVYWSVDSAEGGDTEAGRGFMSALSRTRWDRTFLAVR